MCHIVVYACFFVFDVTPDKYKTQEMCNFAGSLYFSFIVYSPYKQVTKEMCDEAVNDSLAALKLIPDCFVTNTMIKRYLTSLYGDKNILYFD